MSVALLLIRPLPTLLVALYYFFFLRRAAKFWGAPTEKKSVLLLIGAVSLLIGCAMLFLRGKLALFVLLVMLFGMLMDVLHLLLHYPLRKTKWSAIWRCGLVPLLIVAVLLPYGYYHMRDVRETTYTLVTGKIKTPVRILFVSDLHFGTAMDVETLQAYCDKMEETKPDLVVLGGDIVDESTGKEDMRAAFAALGGIESACSTYFIYGNHDRATYPKDSSFTQHELEDAIVGNGITILRDESAQVGELTLYGTEDRSASGRLPAAELLQDAESDRFSLVLSHQPSVAKEYAAAGADLMLSGHTHGGQIWPLGYAVALLGPRCGQYQFGDMTLIVSSGICGWGYDIRTQGVSEYVIVDLLPAE
ncbi:MAG: metallophosphoesterase [Oscillospiraceae bacterium]|nr:metallophosphoesterase [Oscillospiraceae bacterium]